jgi:hypothetical protein
MSPDKPACRKRSQPTGFLAAGFGFVRLRDPFDE